MDTWGRPAPCTTCRAVFTFTLCSIFCAVSGPSFIVYPGPTTSCPITLTIAEETTYIFYLTTPYDALLSSTLFPFTIILFLSLFPSTPLSSQFLSSPTCGGPISRNILSILLGVFCSHLVKTSSHFLCYFILPTPIFIRCFRLLIY